MERNNNTTMEIKILAYGRSWYNAPINNAFKCLIIEPHHLDINKSTVLLWK